MSYISESSIEKHEKECKAKKIVHTWSKDEDKKLLEAIRIFGENGWNDVAKYVTGRTRKQCRERYLNNLSSANEKREWSAAEDCFILSQRSKIGNKWTQISECLSGRSPNAVKNRYFGHLKRLGITERDIVLSMVSQHCQSAFSPVSHADYTVM